LWQKVNISPNIAAGGDCSYHWFLKALYKKLTSRFALPQSGTVQEKNVTDLNLELA